ncbi:IclR family transcriptional regulator [Gryllotalpicola reticulitermitis]|uniref:IclR family transcriptional regulator n=1 Tax=Gryllotalpicola reticulitermitis TaxID=1184153 RepID=A0ABV8Q2X8_9MICO
MEKQYEVGTLQRAIEVLEELATTPQQRLVDLAQSLAVNQSTLLRTLRVLEQARFVQRDANGAYRLGLKLAELGLGMIEDTVASSPLRLAAGQLSRRFDVTVHLGVLNAQAITVIDKFDPPVTLVRYSTLGARMPLHATAAGKAALALAPQIGLEPLDYETARLAPFTPKTILDPEKLRSDVLAAAKRGYSIENGEYQNGFSCVGTAVAVGQEIYTLSLSGPLIETATRAQMGKAVAAAVSELARDHGKLWRPLGQPALDKRRS